MKVPGRCQDRRRPIRGQSRHPLSDRDEASASDVHDAARGRGQARQPQITPDGHRIPAGSETTAVILLQNLFITSEQRRTRTHSQSTTTNQNMKFTGCSCFHHIICIKYNVARQSHEQTKCWESTICFPGTVCYTETVETKHKVCPSVTSIQFLLCKFHSMY
jgi:hypothetical protein